MGHRRAGILGNHCHFLPLVGVTADGCIHCAAVFPEIAHSHGLIYPAQTPVRQLRRQRQMGHIVFCRDNQAGGVLVNAVDNPGALSAAHAGQRIPAMVHQRVHQRAHGVAGSRVHHHAPGLVHHDDVLVLVHHIQGNVLGHQRHVHRLVHHHSIHVARGDFFVFLHGHPVSGDLSLRQQPLRRRPGQTRHLLRQPRVHPGAGHFGGNDCQFHYFSSFRISSTVKPANCSSAVFSFG